MKYCKNCNKEIENDANFCHHCGESVDLVEETFAEVRILEGSYKNKIAWVAIEAIR